MPRQRSTCSRSRLEILRHGGRGGGPELADQLLGHHHDGAEGRAEFVGRRGRQPVELGEVLLAGENQLGGGEGLGEEPRLLRHPPRVDPREGGAEQDRGPDPRDVQERQLDPPVGEPGQRPVHQGQQGREPDRQEAQRERPLRRQRGGGDQDGGEEQQGERVLQAAREEQQRGELHDVEGEQQGRGIVAEPVARREADPQGEVQPGRGGDHQEAPAERQGQAEAELRPDHGGALAGDGEPAQADEGVEPQVSRVAAEAAEIGVGHALLRCVAGRAGRPGRFADQHRMAQEPGPRQADPDEASLAHVVRGTCPGKSPRARDVPPSFRVEHYPARFGLREV